VTRRKFKPGLGHTNDFACVICPSALPGDIALDVFHEHGDDHGVIVDLAGVLLEDQILLIRSTIAQAEVQDLGVGQVRLKHVGVSLAVAHAVARGERVAEDQNTMRAVLARGHLVIAAEAVPVGLHEVPTTFMRYPEFEAGYEAVTQHRVVLHQPPVQPGRLGGLCASIHGSGLLVSWPSTYLRSHRLMAT